MRLGCVDPPPYRLAQIIPEGKRMKKRKREEEKGEERTREGEYRKKKVRRVMEWSCLVTGWY